MVDTAVGAGRAQALRRAAAQESQIAAGIAADPDTHEVSSEEFKTMRPLRGRPHLDQPKEPVKLRLDQDVVAALRATGPGWQMRVNALRRREMLK